MRSSTLVLLHPIGLDGACWQFLDDDVLDGACCYDMLWHGGRSQPTEPLTMRAFAEDVLRNVPGPLDVVGLSMGGAVALEIALNRPDRVRSLMLACSSGGSSDRRLLLPRAEAAEHSGMAGILDATLERWFTRSALDTDDHPGVGYASRRLLSDPTKSFAASWRALAAHNRAGELGRLQAPTTILHAAQDAASAVEPKQRMSAAIHGSRLIVIPGPHMVQLENPGDYSDALRQHLTWADANASRTP